MATTTRKAASNARQQPFSSNTYDNDSNDHHQDNYMTNNNNNNEDNGEEEPAQVISSADMNVNATPQEEQAEEQEQDKKPKVPLWQTLCFILYEYGITASFSFVNAVLVPNQVIEMVGEKQKALALGLILGISSILNIFVGVIAGYVSDYYLQRRRLPFVFVGTVLFSLSITARSFMGYFKPNSSSTALLVTLLVAYTVITSLGKLFYAMAQATYTALIPDLYPRKQFGQASGIMSCFELMGAITGVALLGFVYKNNTAEFPFYVPLLCAIVALLPIATMSTLLVFCKRDGKFHHQQHQQAAIEAATSEPYATMNDDVMNSSNDDGDNETEVRGVTVTKCQQFKQMLISFVRPFKSRDFVFVFLATFVSNMGVSAMQNFFLYFIRDEIHPNYSIFSWNLTGFIKTPEQAQGLFLLVMFGVGICTAALCGLAMDILRARRKYIILIAAVTCALSVVLMLSMMNFTFFIISAATWGVGVGTLVTMMLGLANAVLPDEKESAKDLAVWSKFFSTLNTLTLQN